MWFPVGIGAIARLFTEILAGCGVEAAFCACKKIHIYA